MKIINREENLKLINQKLLGLVEDEDDWTANLANAAALLYNELDRVNWAGFYLMKKGELVLGPFQGLPACIRIQIGNGVCGTAVKDRQTYVVEDVHQFEGHIACDQASKSEIVVPIFEEDEIKGVLDIDSPVKGRFGSLEKEYLKEFVAILVENTGFNF